MQRLRTRSVVCAASLLCAFAGTGAAVRADDAKDKLALAAQPTIFLRTTSASPTDVAAFLKTPVSFSVKDASFLGALDAALGASGKTCPIECRQMKPMKLVFGAKGESIDGVLDTLAKAGGGGLYILPDHLLLSPAALLTDAEKAMAKPYSVLVSSTVSSFPGRDFYGKDLNKPATAAEMLTIANMKTSASVEHGNMADALHTIGSNRVPFSTPNYSIEQRISPERFSSGLGVKDLSLSFDSVPLGEALGTMAHIDGCELYILPGKFLICPPSGRNSLTADERKVAIPAFQYPGIGLPAPSVKKS